MRTLPTPRPLEKKLLQRLSDETDSIKKANNPKAEADKRYSNARKTQWFAPVVKELGRLAGPGERCMFCSGSEASDVEHYRPKAIFPELAMTWENYLWSCTPCNRGKLNRFPPDTGPGGQFVNPLYENVWDFFFIDAFGILTPRFDRAANAPNGRAVTTRDFLSLNRDAVQVSRQQRIKNLKEAVADTMKLMAARKLTKKAARERVETWKSESWQPDVADYFLNGPGRNEFPFKEFLAAIAA
jgi:hypothetical protein